MLLRPPVFQQHRIFPFNFFKRRHQHWIDKWGRKICLHFKIQFIWLLNKKCKHRLSLWITNLREEMVKKSSIFIEVPNARVGHINAWACIQMKMRLNIIRGEHNAEWQKNFKNKRKTLVRFHIRSQPVRILCVNKTVYILINISRINEMIDR